MIQSRLSIDQNDTTSIKYEAPPLGASEIIECLHELGLEISPKDLSHPTKERMRLLYIVLLQLLFDEDDTHQQKDQQDNGGDFDNNTDLGVGQKYFGTDMDASKELISELLLFDKIKLFLERLGAPGFLFADFTHPTSLMVAKTLSVIINYVKSCDTSWQKYETEASQAVKQLEETERLEDEIKELRHRNEETRHALDSFKPPFHVLQDKIEQLEQSLQLLEQTSNDKAEELTRIKIKRHGLKDKVQEEGYKSTVIIGELEALKRRAEVDYPTLLSKIKQAKTKNEQFEVATASENELAETLTRRKDYQSEAFDFISKAYDLEADMTQHWKQLDQLTTNVDNLKEKSHDIDSKLNKLAADKTNIQMKIKDIDTAHTELHAQRSKKRDMISIHMAKLQDEHEKTLQEVAETKQKKQECLEATHQMVLEGQALLDAWKDHVAKKSSELQRLERTLSSYNGCLDALLSG